MSVKAIEQQGHVLKTMQNPIQLTRFTQIKSPLIYEAPNVVLGF